MLNLNFKKLLIFGLLTFCANNSWSQANDACANATLITLNSNCITNTNSFTGQTLSGATSDNYTILNNTCSFITGARDVWYKFLATSKPPIISISNLGANWKNSPQDVKIQLLSGVWKSDKNKHWSFCYWKYGWFIIC